MSHSESITHLAEALALAHAEMPTAKMNSVNPFLKNKFADLGSVIDTARPVLAKHGLSICQLPTSDGELVGLETIVMHKSGEWISNKICLPIGDEKGKSDAQIVGSIITYLRRYSFSAACAMYADEDNDGHNSRQPVQKSADTTDNEQRPRTWVLQQKDALVKEGLAENHPNAKAMLDLSCLPENAGIHVVVSWAKYYRAGRDEGKDQNTAAMQANAKYLEAKKASK